MLKYILFLFCFFVFVLLFLFVLLMFDNLDMPEKMGAGGMYARV